MKTMEGERLRGLAMALAFACLPSCLYGSGYEDLSARIMKCAEANAIKKMAVLEFSAKGGAGRSDTDYAAEKMGLYLAGSGKTALIERALLERVLKETRLSQAGGLADRAETLRSMLSLDAVVTGTVFADGEKLMVMARLIDLKNGRVLLAAEAETERLRRASGDDFFSDLEPPDVPFPDYSSDWSVTGRAPAAGYRDAVAAPAAGSCSARRGRLARLNAELVDAKARYWAVRMKAPGFDRKKLTRNPGSEIADPGVKAAFYKLLSGYYAEDPGAPDPEKMSAVAGLLAEEKAVTDECGQGTPLQFAAPARSNF